MGRGLIWRLKPGRKLELREPSTIRLLEVLDERGRPMNGARVKILVEGIEGTLEAEPGGAQKPLRQAG